MADVNTPLWALYWLAFTLGLRHGFDPDHLTVIDGIVRRNADRNARVASLSGVLFSAGHGLVVIAVALGDAVFAAEWQPPSWLETSFVILAAGLLLALGAINLRTLAAGTSDKSIALRGIRAQSILRLLRVDNPFFIAVAGMFFAISVDTLLLAALFVALSSGQGGLAQVLITALAFTAGMIVVDGLNGVLFTTLVRRADRSGIISRIVTAAVGGFSILLGLAILIGLLSPGVTNTISDHGLWLGTAIAGVTSLCVALVWRKA